jgi:membrane-bound lytic murein transglycosylase D
MKLLMGYAEVNFLLFLAWFFLRQAVRGMESLNLKIPWQLWLKVSYSLVIAAVMLPILSLGLPRKVLLDPPEKMWSEITMEMTASSSLITKRPPQKRNSPVPQDSLPLAVGMGLLVGTLIGIAFHLGRLIQQKFDLERKLSDEPLLKRLGRVRIVASSKARIPYSVWGIRRAYVVLPMSLLGEPKDLELSIRHEIQHHRQGDTRWAWWLEALRGICWINPTVAWLVSLIGEWQEFACDEAVLRRGISAKEYGLCLIRAAEFAMGFRVPRAATCMGGPEHSTLNRRIQKMGKQGRSWAGHGFAVVFFFSCLFVLASCAYLSTSAVSGKKLSRSEAETYAKKTAEGGVIPVVVNDRVLEILNRYVGTSEGRERVRGGLERMPKYQTMIEKKIAEYGLPKELLAIPLLESNYENSAVSGAKAKGLWQFMANTARRYHLVVNENVDERLDEEKETDAAMRYFRDLNHYFNDWQLAIKAYNEGEQRVDKLINKYGTRDAWALDDADSSENYLSGVMASMILLKNPELVN